MKLNIYSIGGIVYIGYSYTNESLVGLFLYFNTIPSPPVVVVRFSKKINQEVAWKNRVETT